MPKTYCKIIKVINGSEMQHSKKPNIKIMFLGIENFVPILW
jgi:hypothetical protein